MSHVLNSEPTLPPTRPLIRSSWMNYIHPLSYDITRSVLDFFLEGTLKPMADYASTKSNSDSKIIYLAKAALGTISNFFRPITQNLSHVFGTVISFGPKYLIGGILGSLWPQEKKQPYVLDNQNMGWINRTVTDFSTRNFLSMAIGALSFNLIFPKIGHTLLSRLGIGAGIGFGAKQILPKLFQFFSLAKWPTFTEDKTSLSDTLSSSDDESDTSSPTSPHSEQPGSANDQPLESPASQVFTPSFAANSMPLSLAQQIQEPNIRLRLRSAAKSDKKLTG